jgi:hypothetical protein
VRKNAVALLVFSVTSMVVWTLLNKFNLIDPKLLTALVLLSVIVVIYTSYNFLLSFDFENTFFKYTFILFIFYEIIIVLRGMAFSYNDIKEYLQSGITFWPFVIPVFVFFDKKISTIALLFKWIYNLGLFFLVLCLVFPTLLLQRLTAEDTITIATTSGFIFMNATYMNYRKVNISFIIIIISLLSVIYLARRNAILTLTGFIFTGYILNLVNKSKLVLIRFFPIFIGLILFIFSYLPNYSSIITSKMEARMSEDTRSGLFEMFFFQMRDDLAFGKGMNGTYYYPTGGELEDEGITFADQDYRNLIENGYLQLMLNGGIVYIILFLLITLPAAVIGIFKSSNQLARACGVLILLWLLDMIAYGLPRFILHYILVWISVGICYSTSLRNLTDEEVRDEFKKVGLA